MRTTINIIFLILILCIGGFYYNHLLLGTFTAIGVVLNLFLFYRDKISLKEAIYYVRPLRKTLTNIEKTTIVLATILVVGFLLKDYLHDDIRDFLSEGMSIYFWVFTLSLILSTYYLNFRNSVRSFKYGIVIPKHKKRLPWKSIDKIGINETNMVIESQEIGRFTFELNKRDSDEAIKIKKQYEKNAYNTK